MKMMVLVSKQNKETT